MADHRHRSTSSSSPRPKGGFGTLTEHVIQEIIYTVYASCDVGTLRSLCLVSGAVSQMAEELIYDQLEVVSTNNLGNLVNISQRQKRMIKSLKITDRTPTIHTDPNIVWSFISSLPNLESLDIQYTVLPFTPSSKLHLPNLRTFNFRIISPLPTRTNQERLAILTQRRSLRDDFPPTRPSLPYKDIAREPENFISQIAISMPALKKLSVLLIGPYENIQYSLKAQKKGQKLKNLQSMEIIIAEPLLENVQDVVTAFVGYDGSKMQLKYLSVITKHQKMTCSLPVSDPRHDDSTSGYLRNLAIPSLEHLSVAVDRIFCPHTCKIPIDQQEDACFLPTIPQLHRQIHNWCNAMTSLLSFDFSVRLRDHKDGKHHSAGELPDREEHHSIWFYRAEFDFKPRDDDGEKFERILYINWKRKQRPWPKLTTTGKEIGSVYHCTVEMIDGEPWDVGSYQNRIPLADVKFVGTHGRLVGQRDTAGVMHHSMNEVRSFPPPGFDFTFSANNDEVTSEDFTGPTKEVLQEVGLRFKGDDIVAGDEIEGDHTESEEIDQYSGQLEEEEDDFELGDDRYFGHSDEGSGSGDSGRTEQSSESIVGIKRSGEMLSDVRRGG